MEKDQRDLLRVFNERKVRYLIVGGYAVSYFTEPRVTKDLDVFIDTSDENVAIVYDALASFGAPLAGMTPKDFQDPAWGYQIGQPPSRIDILQELTAIDFDSAWKAGEDGTIDGDIPVRYISVDDLIKNKLALGRHRDLADVEAIRESEAANAKRLTKD
jgi:predicted nucleotidyltransferase